MNNKQTVPTQEFAEYYLSKHGGRKLAWHSTSSNCIVRAQLGAGTKELQASMHQVGTLRQPMERHRPRCKRWPARPAGPAHIRHAPVPARQATILLLFNDHDQLSLEDIAAAIKLDETELRRTLASLCLAKEK